MYKDELDDPKFYDKNTDGKDMYLSMMVVYTIKVQYFEKLEQFAQQAGSKVA